MDPFTALAIGGGLIKSIGEFQAQSYQADQAKKAAEVGRIRAQQIDTSYREELSSTIANIRTIRAATGVGANSPTTLALEAENRRVSDRNRTRDVANQRIQANQDEADGKFLKKSAGLSLGLGLMTTALKLKE